MTGEKANLSFRIPAERYDTFAKTLFKRFFILQQNVTTFDFRISKKLTFYVFKHELKN